MNEPMIFMSKPKEFKWMAFVVLIASFGWIASMMMKTDIRENPLQPLALGVFALAIFYFFWNYGNKKRSIEIYDDKIEYKNPKLAFSANFKDVLVIKTFQDVNRSTENLVILTEDDTLSVSTAFFDSDKLHECFFLLLEKARNFENIKIEDDRLWAETGTNDADSQEPAG